MSSTPTDDALYGTDKGDNFYETGSSPSTELGDSASANDDAPLDESPEERERRMAELKEELAKVESEIHMLRQVLGSKVRHATELKRKLGITPFQEFKQDLQSGIQQIKSSDSYQKTNDTLHQLNEKISHTQAYQKTSAVVKTATEKTSSAINTMGQAVVRKMGDIKNSQTFKSFDEKMHTTYANVKSSRSIEGLKERLAKVTGSHSSNEINKAYGGDNPSDERFSTPEAADDATNVNLPEEKVPL